MIFVKIPKYVTFDHFLFFTTISLNNYYGPGNWTCIKKIQSNWNNASPSTTFVVPP